MHGKRGLYESCIKEAILPFGKSVSAPTNVPPLMIAFLVNVLTLPQDLTAWDSSTKINETSMLTAEAFGNHDIVTVAHTGNPIPISQKNSCTMITGGRMTRILQHNDGNWYIKGFWIIIVWAKSIKFKSSICKKLTIPSWIQWSAKSCSQKQRGRKGTRRFLPRPWLGAWWDVQQWRGPSWGGDLRAWTSCSCKLL